MCETHSLNTIIYSRHVLYILYNETNRWTYNGYTVDFNHRLRQHNCEIKGGAKYTSKYVKSHQVVWKPLAIIKIPEIEGINYDQRRALSVEYSIRYPSMKRPRPAIFNGAKGRVKGLALAIQNPKFQDLTFHVTFFSDDMMRVFQEALDICMLDRVTMSVNNSAT